MSPRTEAPRRPGTPRGTTAPTGSAAPVQAPAPPAPTPSATGTTRTIATNQSGNGAWLLQVRQKPGKGPIGSLRVLNGLRAEADILLTTSSAKALRTALDVLLVEIDRPSARRTQAPAAPAMIAGVEIREPAAEPGER